jgi:hypothetical protein
VRRVSTVPADLIHANFRLRLDLTPALLGALAAVVGAVLVLAATASAATPRAYEMVTPLDSNGQDVSTSGGILETTASPDGEALLFMVWAALPGSKAGGILTANVSYRGTEEWQTDFLAPLQDPAPTGGSSVQFASQDMGKFVVQGPISPQPAPGTGEGTINLFHYEVATEVFKPITVGTAPDSLDTTSEAVGASNDLSKVVFQYRGDASLVEGSEPNERQLYVWNEADGTVDIVGRHPGTNAPIAGQSYLGSFRYDRNAISSDGSTIFFGALFGEDRKVLARIDGSETVDLTASQETVPDDEDGTAHFLFASDDGSVAYFISGETLTDDAVGGPESADLYRYDLEARELTNLTVEPLGANGAEVLGPVAASNDGSRIYFAARGVLAPGGEEGANNVYMWTDDGTPKGSIEFVAADVEPQTYEFSSFPSGKSTARTTADGSKLLFTSKQSLTGYPTNSTTQGYLYDAETGELSCVTCNPLAESSSANAELSTGGSGDVMAMNRMLTADGSRVFFSSVERLTPEDEDSGKDVYEYETTTEQLTLLSSGQSNQPSRFHDASTDGRDVFFSTRDALVPIDTNENMNVYDARIGGGLASQSPPPPPIPCSAGECQTPLPAAPPVVPGSATFQGPGNQAQKGKRSQKAKKCRKQGKGKKKRGKRCAGKSGKRHGRR